MDYCPDCRALCAGRKRCPVCGGRRLRPVRPEDPVFLASLSEQESGIAAGALKDAGIPCMEQREGAGGVSSVFLGRSRSAGVNLYVPYGGLKRGGDVLRGVGLLRERETERSEKPGPEDRAEPKKQKPSSTGEKGQKAARIFSILLFLLAVALVAVLTDLLTGWLRSVFHW